MPGQVLIVEDDLDIRESLAELLELQGYGVLQAHDGRAALDVLAAGARPGLILLDLMMPGMDGATFLEEQRARPELAQIPVVVLTAARVDLSALAPTAVLLKPVVLEELWQVLEEHAV